MIRPAVIATASVVGVVAVAAVNVGILSAADPAPLGELSASAETSTTGAATLEVSSTSDSTVGEEDPWVFEIDPAGSVEAAVDGRQLEVTAVTTAEGWTSRILVDRGDTIRVGFASADDRFDFTATINEDGTIDSALEPPLGPPTSTPTASTRPAPTTPTSTRTDDSASSTEHRDDEHDDDEHDDAEHDEHEGRDDDD